VLYIPKQGKALLYSEKYALHLLASGSPDKFVLSFFLIFFRIEIQPFGEEQIGNVASRAGQALLVPWASRWQGRKTCLAKITICD